MISVDIIEIITNNQTHTKQIPHMFNGLSLPLPQEAEVNSSFVPLFFEDPLNIGWKKVNNDYCVYI